MCDCCWLISVYFNRIRASHANQKNENIQSSTLAPLWYHGTIINVVAHEQNKQQNITKTNRTTQQSQTKKKSEKKDNKKMMTAKASNQQQWHTHRKMKYYTKKSRLYKL